MQITKTYKNLQPELLYYELKDFLLEKGMKLGENKLETFSTPTDSSLTIFQGSLTFKTANEPQKEGVRARMQGTTEGETKLVIEIDEKVLSQRKSPLYKRISTFSWDPMK